MTKTQSKILMRTMTGLLFVSAAALGVGSAQGQATPPSNTTVSGTVGVTSGTNATAAPSNGPVVVSGPKDPPPPAATTTFGSAAENSEAAAAAAKRGSNGLTSAAAAANVPFVPSQIETIAPAPVGKDRRPTAVLHTTKGDIIIRFFKTEAPHTVQNFLDLAKGEREFLDPKTSKKVHRPFYTGLLFHRVLKDFVIQTGCPFGTGRGDPGYNIPDEISPNLKHDRPGIVSMALAQDQKAGYEKNSNGSQFFITLSPQPTFDGKFTIFGEVIGGMDVARRIGSVATGPTDRPIKKVYLLSIDVNEPTPDLMQAAGPPMGVNLAAPQLPPQVNNPPPVNTAASAGQNLPATNAPPQPAVPALPVVDIPPMPASTQPAK